MSADLKDFRGKVTVETFCQLEAEHRVSGKDKSDIAREVLHEWAMKKLNVAKIADALLRSEGEPGITEGIAGKMREGGRK